MKFNLLTAAILTSGVAFGAQANAAMTTDGHGNVGYDTYEECVAAVKNNTAKFYTPYTYEKPKPGNGEISVKQMPLNQVTIPAAAAANMPVGVQNYNMGACDRGVGRSNGRAGVSGVLVGKYVPFDPNMMVNVYMDRQGTPVRLTMQQCDNHFSGRFPVGVVNSAPTPEAQLRIEEDVQVESIVTNEVRSIRPVYRVKEVVVAPAGQIQRIETPNGTAVAVQNAANEAVVLGQEAGQRILDRAITPAEVPVIVIPEVNVPDSDMRVPNGSIKVPNVSGVQTPTRPYIR